MKYKSTIKMTKPPIKKTAPQVISPAASAPIPAAISISDITNAMMKKYVLNIFLLQHVINTSILSQYYQARLNAKSIIRFIIALSIKLSIPRGNFHLS